MDEIKHLEEMLEIKQDNLRFVEKKIAVKGSDVSFELQNEQKGLRNEIKSLESRIRQLQGAPSDEVVSNLPSREPFFGRAREIEECLNAINPQQQGWGAIVDGVGGIGKTALAKEVAYLAKQKGMFDTYLFESAKTTRLETDGIKNEIIKSLSLDGFIRSFSQALKFVEVLDETDSDNRIRAFLSNMIGRRSLLVFDNIETLPLYERDKVAEFLVKLPQGNKAILTSRIRTGEAAKTIRLGQLSELEIDEIIQNIRKSLPDMNKEWQRANESLQADFKRLTGGNPLMIRYAAGRIDASRMKLDEVVNLLAQTPSDEAFTFLFADAVNSLNPKEIEILFSLAYSESVEPQLISTTLGIPLPEIQRVLSKLVVLSLVNERNTEVEKYSLNEVFKNYAIIMAHRASTGVIESDSKVNPKILINVSNQVLSYWVNFAVTNGSQEQFDLKVIDNNWNNIASACQSLFELSGLPNKITGKNFANDLIRIANTLCELDGPLMSLGLWDECIQIGIWGYMAAYGMKDYFNALILSTYIAQIYSRREENEKAEEWVDKCKDVDNKLKHDNASKDRLKYEFSFLVESKERVAILQQQLGDMKTAGGISVKLAQVTRSLGETYQELGDFQSAEKAYLEALEIAGDLIAPNVRAYILVNLGYTALKKKRESFTLGWTNWLESLFPNKMPDWVGWVFLLPAIASFLIEAAVDGLLGTSKPDFEAAQRYFVQALEIARSQNNKVIDAQAQLGLATVFKATRQKTQALKHAKIAKEIYDQRLKGPPSKIKEINDLIKSLES